MLEDVEYLRESARQMRAIDAWVTGNRFDRIANELERLREENSQLRRRPARLSKPNWTPKLPAADWRCVAILDGEEWHWGYEHNDEFVDGEGWPFYERYVVAEDWQRLGFEVRAA